MVEHLHARGIASAADVNVAAVGKSRAVPVPGIEPNLRRLRVCLAVYEQGGIQRAAAKLHLSQSSVTRAVQQLEFQVGRPLFERTSKGMGRNALGDILADRTRQALKHLDLAETEINSLRRSLNKVVRPRFLSTKVTYPQLRALIAIADFQTQTVAARSLALTQPALTISLRSLEKVVGESLFLRTPRGMVATPVGDVLSRRAKLAFSEILAATSDISARVGVLSGSIVVGILPLSGTLLAPRAVNRLLREHPSIKIKLVDGTYQSQIQGLLCGDIDLIVGGLDYQAPAEIIQQRLFNDWLSIVVRKEHPLFRKRSLGFSDLAGAEWVVPPEGTPARISFDRVMTSVDLTVGSNPIIANASPVRALVIESDRLAVMSRHQIYFEECAGLLAVLPLQLSGTDLPIGIRTRANAVQSASVSALICHLRDLSAEMRNS